MAFREGVWRRAPPPNFTVSRCYQWVKITQKSTAYKWVYKLDFMLPSVSALVTQAFNLCSTSLSVNNLKHPGYTRSIGLLISFDFNLKVRCIQ